MINTRPAMDPIAELASLRGKLVVSIVAFHLHIRELFFWIWSFVDSFLLLSGFETTRRLLVNPPGASTPFNFYARRAIRIWPVYFLTTLVAVSLSMGDRRHP